MGVLAKKKKKKKPHVAPWPGFVDFGNLFDRNTFSCGVFGSVAIFVKVTQHSLYLKMFNCFLNGRIKKRIV